MGRIYRDEDVIKTLRAYNADLFGGDNKNNIEDLYVTTNGVRIGFRKVRLTNKQITMLVPVDLKAVPSKQDMPEGSETYVYMSGDLEMEMTFSVDPNLNRANLESLDNMISARVSEQNSNCTLIEQGTTTKKGLPYFLLCTSQPDKVKTCELIFLGRLPSGIMTGKICKPEREYTTTNA